MTPSELKDAHALAIGKIVMAWNEYHEIFGEIFAGLFTKSHWETSLAIWHCLDSDRTQRKLLRAAAETHLRWNEKGLEELFWLLNKTDSLIAHQRNLGVHAPLMSITELDGTHKVQPLAMLGNRNAKQMVGKDILREYAHYEQQIKEMSSFAYALRFKLALGKHTDDPWPERPRLSSRPS
jgi:hypothetical protein